MAFTAFESQTLPVLVAPTATVLYGPVPMRNLAIRLAVQLTNLDGSQTLNAWVETRLGPSDPFYRETAVDLDEIEPGTTRRATWDVRGCREARVMGTASGAGLAATITVATENV